MSELETEEPDVEFEGEQDDSQPDEEPTTEEQAAEAADDGTDLEGFDGEQDAEPEARGLSEQEIEKRYKALEKEAKRHAATIERTMGDDAAELIVCPLCEPELQGFLRMESLDHPRDELHGAMIGVLKKPTQVEFKPAPHAVECHDCDGLGQVLSGSRVAGKERIVCPTCTGNGYLQHKGAPASPDGIQPTSLYVPSDMPHEPLDDERDEFGSPRYLDDGRENPNYGKTMRYKDATIEDDYLKRLAGVS